MLAVSHSKLYGSAARRTAQGVLQLRASRVILFRSRRREMESVGSLSAPSRSRMQVYLKALASFAWNALSRIVVHVRKAAAAVRVSQS